ncbi:hypothetical protein FOZ63_028792 [Perkinsus olseni]|uniref:Uncharacterized protein n=1 Tax=Perkinsus olseni TaxID=32597 RepID=A0A7J6PS15_PEROL|nr:hypothetical protein FOZ63_028792 [Perkinsus olseni]KAF4723388.1 hypothetical protein FOZ62_026807 [Perkinsus olseni]
MTSRLPRQVGMKLKDSKQPRVACGAEFPTPRKSKHNFTATSKQVDEMLRSGDVKAGEMVLAKMVDAAREPVQLSQTLQKLARIRKAHSLNRTVDDLADRVLDRLGRISLSHIPARTACTILRSTEGLPNASSSSIVETINDDLILKEGSVLLSSATPLDLAMLLHFLSGRASDESAMVSLVDALKLRAPELDNVSYPIALTSLAKIPSSEEARESVLGQLSQVIPSMTGAQLAQTYEGLQEMGVIDEDNAERIMTSFLSITSGSEARDWARLMAAVARARPQDLPHLLECAQPLISDAQWGSARELVERSPPIRDSRMVGPSEGLLLIAVADIVKGNKCRLRLVITKVSDPSTGEHLVEVDTEVPWLALLDWVE